MFSLKYFIGSWTPVGLSELYLLSGLFDKVWRSVRSGACLITDPILGTLCSPHPLPQQTRGHQQKEELFWFRIIMMGWQIQVWVSCVDLNELLVHGCQLTVLSCLTRIHSFVLCWHKVCSVAFLIGTSQGSVTSSKSCYNWFISEPTQIFLSNQEVTPQCQTAMHQCQ